MKSLSTSNNQIRGLNMWFLSCRLNVHAFSSVCARVFPVLLSIPLHREVNGIDACVIPAQALSSAALFSPPAAPWPPNNHTPLFLFTICQRWRENWRKGMAEKKGAGAVIDRLPHVLKPDIDFLSFFSNGKKCIVRPQEISMGIWGKRSWNEHPVHCCLLWIVYRAVVIELSEQGPSPICALLRVFGLSMYL